MSFVNQAQPSSELEVVYRSPGELLAYPGNARRHPKTQIKKLKSSIAEFGFTNPILVDMNGMVLCGHGRLEAARELGMGRVPTIALEHLSESARRAYVVADNALAAKSNWDRQLLRSELQGLIDIGYNVELTGLDTFEIDTVLSMDPDVDYAADELVELPSDDDRPLTQLGDHWVIGRHHLLCSDARLGSSYEALLGNERAELTFTDPPYNTSAERISGLGRVKHGAFIAASGELSDGAFVMDFLRPTLRHIERFSVPGAIAFVCSDWRMDPLLREAASGVFAEQKNLIVWAKTNAGMGSFYRSQVELIQAWKVSRGPTINNFQLGQGGRHRSNLWVYPGANTFRRGRMEDLQDHPTTKPVKLVRDAVLDCSRRGGIILDPFLGSGTTLAAAETTGRRGYGLELDPAYCDVILRRLSKATSAEPYLLDGTPMSAVVAQRSITEKSS